MIAKIVPAVRLPLRTGETYDYTVPQNLASAIVPGSVVCVPFSGRLVTGVVLHCADSTAINKPLHEISSVVPELNPLPFYVLPLWSKLAAMFATTLPRFLWAALPVIPKRSSAIQSVKKIEIQYPKTAQTLKNICITQQQTSASNVINEIVPGTLLMVPTVNDVNAWTEFASRSSLAATPYHAGLAMGQKFKIAAAANSGNLPLVIGTKSAALLPFAKLKKIIIWQAGSSSLLQEDSDPRVDMRIICHELAKECGAELVIFDALPPLGLMLLSPCSGRQVQFQIHNLGEELKRTREHVFLGEPILQAISAALRSGKRALILLNRRGLSSSLVCSDCGTALNCSDCKLPLTVHETELACFACEHSYPIPERCTHCQGMNFKKIGMGSKALAQFLQKKYKEVSLVHIDADTDKNIPPHVQIVVGTTAVFGALPLDSEPFDVVVDALLGAGTVRSGYAANEETARTLLTLASFLSLSGILHIQTFDAKAAALLALHSLHDFYKQEMSERGALNYPPACILMTLLGAHKDEQILWNEALVLVSELKAKYPALAVLEPSWGHPKRFRGLFRARITVKWQDSHDYANLISSLHSGWSADVRFL